MGVGRLTVLVTALALETVPAAAQEAAPDSAPVATPQTPLQLRVKDPPPPVPSRPSWPLQVFLIGGLILGTGAYVVWKRKAPNFSLGELEPSLRIVSRVAAGVRSEILLVDADGTRLVIGVTPGSMQALTILDGPSVEVPRIGSAAEHEDGPEEIVESLSRRLAEHTPRESRLESPPPARTEQRVSRRAAEVQAAGLARFRSRS
jgi:flagellar biogenesis protein FliO